MYVLMSRKTQESYTHLFIKAHIFDLKPTSFMTDYERAMRNGLHAVWPDAGMFACWFHYCQAIKKHASQIPQFMTIARSDGDRIKLYYEIMCLPLLPAD